MSPWILALFAGAPLELEVDTSTEAEVCHVPEGACPRGFGAPACAPGDVDVETAVRDLEHLLGFPTGALDLGEGDDLDLRDLSAPMWTHTATGGVAYDIPLAAHPAVADWIRYLTTRGRGHFERWLGRLTRYRPIFERALAAEGVPRDLIFLAMIESGFSAKAYSFAHAAGYWQFVPGTARRFGLRVDFWVDERRDFERSATAAARYLKLLHDEFGDWHLAFAAYNAGEGKIRRAIRRHGRRSYFELSRTSALRRETRQYVPKLIAAAVVAKHPARFGLLGVRYQPPVEFSTVDVDHATEVSVLAAACGASVGELEELNPSLIRKITPPGGTYRLRVPLGTARACALGLAAIPLAERRSFRVHRVSPGDTARTIAERYRTDPAKLLAYNKLAEADLGRFDAILVPIPLSVDAEVPVDPAFASYRYAPPFVPGGDPVRVHRVRPGDSLWRIARQYGVSVRRLREWNDLFRPGALRVGQPIRILLGQR